MNNPETTEVWTRAMSNVLGRLTQSNVYGVKHTDTIEFIKWSEVPAERDVTYANFILDYRPLNVRVYLNTDDGNWIQAGFDVEGLKADDDFGHL